MVLLHDGSPGEGADWTGLEMLPGPAPDAPVTPAPRGGLQRLRRWSAVAAALLVPGFVGAHLQQWADSPRRSVPEEAAVAVFVVDVSRAQQDAGLATVSLRNTSSKTVTLLGLSAASGAMVASEGTLPRALPAETVTTVTLRRGSCSASRSWTGAVDATVRVGGGLRRATAFQFVGDSEHVSSVNRASEDACLSLPARPLRDSVRAGGRGAPGTARG